MLGESSPQDFSNRFRKALGFLNTAFASARRDLGPRPTNSTFFGAATIYKACKALEFPLPLKLLLHQKMIKFCSLFIAVSGRDQSH